MSMSSEMKFEELDYSEDMGGEDSEPTVRRIKVPLVAHSSPSGEEELIQNDLPATEQPTWEGGGPRARSVVGKVRGRRVGSCTRLSKPVSLRRNWKIVGYHAGGGKSGRPDLLQIEDANSVHVVTLDEEVVGEMLGISYKGELVSSILGGDARETAMAFVGKYLNPTSKHKVPFFLNQWDYVWVDCMMEPFRAYVERHASKLFIHTSAVCPLWAAFHLAKSRYENKKFNWAQNRTAHAVQRVVFGKPFGDQNVKQAMEFLEKYSRLVVEVGGAVSQPRVEMSGVHVDVEDGERRPLTRERVKNQAEGRRRSGRILRLHMDSVDIVDLEKGADAGPSQGDGEQLFCPPSRELGRKMGKKTPAGDIVQEAVGGSQSKKLKAATAAAGVVITPRNHKGKELEAKDRQLRDKGRELEAMERELEAKDRQIRAKDTEIAAKDQRIRTMETELAAKDQQMKTMEGNREKDKETFMAIIQNLTIVSRRR